MRIAGEWRRGTYGERLKQGTGDCARADAAAGTRPLAWTTIEAVRLKTFLQLLALSALWGASFPMLRVASPLLGPSVLSMLRLGIATLTLALIMRAAGQRWPWEHWRELVLLSVLAVAGPFFLFSWAALRLPAGYVALLNSTSVVFGVLASTWLKEDRLTQGKVLGCVCGLLGVGMIVRLGPVQPTAEVLLGTAAALLGAVCFGFSVPLMKRTTRRMEPLEIAGPLHAAALLFVLPGGLWNLPQARFSVVTLLIVLVLGVLTSGVAFWMHLRILRHITPVASMSPMFFIPVFGVTWGHVLLGEQVSSGIYLGGAMVLLAAALVTGFNPLRRRPAP